MTDPLDGIVDEDIDDLLDGTTGGRPADEHDATSDRGRSRETGDSGRYPDENDRGPSPEPEEVRLSPDHIEDDPAYERPDYDVVLDHEGGRAVLVEPGSADGDGRYQVLGEEPELDPGGYEGHERVEPTYPSAIAEMGAVVTATTISSGFATAEAGLEAFYNGLRGLVGLMD